MSVSTKLGFIVGIVGLLFAAIILWKPSNINAIGANVRLPELSSAGIWLNTKPLTHKDLENKVVMLDIWDFTCVNCLRTLPYLKKWHQTYAKDGLVIIGVHCPEFSFGKDSINVVRFVNANQLTYPIVLDNQYQIWNALYNRYWPRKMIFAQGKLVYDHIGEGAYEETEQVIQEQLSKLTGKTYPKVEMHYVREEDRPNAICYPRSPEIYAGYSRGRIGNAVQPLNKAIHFGEEDQHPKENLPYLSGEWLQTEEYLKYLGSQNGHRDRLTLAFTGNEVNVVLRSDNDLTIIHPIRISITLNDSVVPENWRGEDVLYSAVENITYIELREPRMYRLLYAPKEHGEHILKLYPLKKGVEIYAFTFGSCRVDF